MGLVLEWYKYGDLRKLLDQAATHLSNEQKWVLLMDIAEVTNRNVSVAPPRSAHRE